jgi:hypothetical protein
MTERKRKATNPLKASAAKRARVEGQDKRSSGRKNEAVLHDFTPAQLLALWEANKDNIEKQPPLSVHRDGCSDCWLWKGSLQNGYPAISRGGSVSKLKVHMLACWSRTHQIAESGQTTAHRCHMKRCINPEHLDVVSIKDNNDAKGCLCCFTVGDDVYDLCWHVPKCLASDAANNNGFVPRVIQ